MALAGAERALPAGVRRRRRALLRPARSTSTRRSASATTCAARRSTRCASSSATSAKSPDAARPIVPLGPGAVDAAGARARAPAGQADEPRQPRVDAAGQRLRLPVSARCSASRPTALEAIAPPYLAPDAARSPYDAIARTAAAEPRRSDAHAAGADARDGASRCRSRVRGSTASADRCATSCSAARSPTATGSSSARRPRCMLASGYRPVGRDFPVFLHPETHEEYALARTERKHGPRLPRLRVLRLARRDARGGPRAPRPHDQRDGARRRRRADRSLRRRAPTSRPACCATCRRRSPRIRCACCASRASPRASASPSRRRPRR